MLTAGPVKVPERLLDALRWCLCEPRMLAFRVGELAALLGWAAGSVGIGILIGAVLGIPGGIVAVYRRYRSFFA